MNSTNCHKKVTKSPYHTAGNFLYQEEAEEWRRPEEDLQIRRVGTPCMEWLAGHQ